MHGASTASVKSLIQQGRLTQTATAAAVFLTQFELTALATVLPAITYQFGIDVTAAAWIIDAYSLAFTLALVMSGVVVDRHGATTAFRSGNALFLLASLACAASPDLVSLSLARTVQGCGAALMIAGALAITALTERNAIARAKAFGRLGVASGTGMLIGPLLGAQLLTLTGWPGVFWAMVPVCLAMHAVPLPSNTTPGPSTNRLFDTKGAVLLCAGLTLLIGALLNIHHPLWAATGIVAAVGILFMFGCHEASCPHPLFKPAIFLQRPILAVACALIAVSVTYWAPLVFLPAILTFSNWSNQWISLALAATVLPMLVVPPLASRLIVRIGWRHHFTAGLALLAVGNVLISSCAATLPLDVTAPLVAGLVLLGVGAALLNAQLSGAAAALVPPADVGMATAFTMVVRQSSFVVGVAAVSIILSMPDIGSALVFSGAALVALGACALVSWLLGKPPAA